MFRECLTQSRTHGEVKRRNLVCGAWVTLCATRSAALMKTSGQSRYTTPSQVVSISSDSIDVGADRSRRQVTGELLLMPAEMIHSLGPK